MNKPEKLAAWLVEAIATENRTDMIEIARLLNVPVYYRRGKLKVFKAIRDISVAIEEMRTS